MRVSRYNRFFFKLIIILFFVLLFPNIVVADYVLPYPSYMPGNKLYKLSRILDQVNRWWYWGNFAAVKYRLHLSDKYLVEAKTLFEYKQYQLAVDALERSDNYFGEIPEYVYLADKEGKDISKVKETLSEATLVHLNILSKLETELPEKYIWKPEKQASKEIRIRTLIQKSEQIRKIRL